MGFWLPKVRTGVNELSFAAHPPPCDALTGIKNSSAPRALDKGFQGFVLGGFIWLKNSLFSVLILKRKSNPLKRKELHANM